MTDRPAVPRDLATVSSWIDSREACERWAGESVRFPLQAEDLASELGLSDHRSIVLVSAKRVVGFGQLVMKDGERGHLARLIIAPSWRGHGLGRALVKRLLEQAIENGAKTASLRVSANNARARKLYASMGFQVVSRSANEAESEHLYMELPLRGAATYRRVRSDWIALGSAAGALCLWSGTTVATKVAVASIDSLTVGILRSSMAGILASGVVVVLRVKPPQRRVDLARVIISGVASFAIWPALLSVGVGGTTAGHAGLVIALIPVMTVMFSHLGSRRGPGPKWWCGALIAISATALLMLGRGVTFEPAENGAGLLGDLTVFAGCGICAVGYIAGGRLSPSFGAFATTLWGLVAATFVTLPLAGLLAHRTSWAQVPPSGWLAVGFLTICCSFLGYALWFFALGRGGVRRIGSLQLALPALTLVVATLLLGETLSGLSALAAVILMSGTYIAHRHAS